jgi:hypothetical protein
MNKRQKIVQQAFLDDEEKVINKLKNQYSHSLKEIEKKAQNLQEDIEQLDTLAKLSIDDEEKEKILSQRRSKVYQKQYQDSLKKQVSDILDTMHENEFKTVSEYLNKCYEQGFLGAMYDLQGQGIPLCFPLDQEAMVRAVQLDSKISQGLYKRLGEDVNLLKRKIAAQISRGISTGMTFPQIAQQLAGVTNIGFNNAVRIARTEGHRIQCQSGMDACYKAKEKGADVVKQWDSTLDSATRESHVAVDGEIRELDEPFSNGLMFAGDPRGSAAEVVNCRCALLQRARWAVGGSFTKMNNFTKQIETFESVDDYDEFKKAFFSKENKQYMNYHQQLEERYKTKDFNKLLNVMNDEEYQHYSKLLNATPIYKNIEVNQTVKITKKNHTSDYGVVDRGFVNSKAFHDKFETITNHKAVSESLYQESMKMLEHRDGTGLEDLMMIDSKTGKVIESVLDSKEVGKVKITKEQYKKIVEYNGKLTMLHNHPNGSRPSITDIKKLKVKNIDIVVSVGHDGSVYKISNLNPKSDIDKIWDEAYNDYVKLYKDDILAEHHALDDIYAMGIFDLEVG